MLSVKGVSAPSTVAALPDGVCEVAGVSLGCLKLTLMFATADNAALAAKDHIEGHRVSAAVSTGRCNSLVVLL